mgnify:CR=1 FL=1
MSILTDESLFMPTAIALTANAHPPALRSRAVSLLTTAQIAGTVGGSWFGGWMADRGQWRGAIGRGDAQPHSAYHCEVGKVVTDKGNFIHGYIHIFQQLVERCQLVFTSLNHRGNTELIGAALHQSRGAAGDNAYPNALFLQQFNTKTVLDIKGL